MGRIFGILYWIDADYLFWGGSVKTIRSSHEGFLDRAGASLSLELGFYGANNVAGSLVFIHAALDELARMNDRAVVLSSK